MDIKVYPGRLKGTVQAPPSKSLAHRALICAALSDGKCTVHGISGSRDMDATIGCLRVLGAKIERSGSDAYITGIFADRNTDKPAADAESCDADISASEAVSSEKGAPAVMDCLESGSTLRFLLPVAAVLGADAEFRGRGKLPERPMTPLADELKKKGIDFQPDGRDMLPFSISGRLEPGVFEIPGNVSSQYISGLMFALPVLDGDSDIVIKGKLESASYIDLTVDMLKSFGVTIEKTSEGYHIAGGQRCRAAEMTVEGDHSNAAFWLAAGAMGSELTVKGLNMNSAQGDRRALDILMEMGAEFIVEDGSVTAVNSGSPAMNGIAVDCSDIPDIVPILSVAASAAQGAAEFLNAGRLRIKESDRLAAMAESLTAMGADVLEKEDSLHVKHSRLNGGCVLDGHNDHRIVMSCAIAALSCSEPVVIRGAEAVSKSYPDFFDVFSKLGGRAVVITVR